jgi:LuxR family maltose regulon positive regulatory protein
MNRIEEERHVEAHLARALVHLGRDERALTNEALASMSAALEHHPNGLLEVARRLVTIRLLVADGRGADVSHLLDEVERSTDRLPHPGFLTDWYGVAYAEAALAVGDPAAVIDHIGARNDASPGVHERALAARALLRLRRLEEGSTRIVELVNSPGLRGLPAVDAWLVVAESAVLGGQGAVAREAVDRALDLAAPALVRRPFSLAGPEVRELVARHSAEAGRHAAVAQELLERDDHHPSPVASVQGPAKPWVTNLPEHLTAREQTVLDLLPLMMTNTEIADELVISVNTVKAHLKSLYRKLSVSNRREAVLVARFGLLTTGATPGDSDADNFREPRRRRNPLACLSAMLPCGQDVELWRVLASVCEGLA